jgi:hypothetical protein
MKTLNPNPLFNLQAHYVFEKINQIMSKKVILLLMFVFYYTGISAQNLSTIQDVAATVPVSELTSYLDSASKSTNTAELTNAQNVKSLTTLVHSSVYLYGGTLRTYGEKPKKLFTDLASVATAPNSIIDKNNIEIIIIRIENASQFNSSIDLSLLSSFKNLKYIYFVSNIPTTNDAISRMISNYTEKYSVFYKIEKGDTNQ